MPKDVAQRQGRPRVLPPHRQRFNVVLSTEVAGHIRSLAAEGRRPVNTQVEILIERGLKSYGLEVSAA